MSHKKDNDPFSYLYRQFSSLEFKQQETIKNLINNYYPLNKEEEIFIKDISIENKNEFISQIKKIFHELSISMETIEYIFNQYYHFIINNSNNKDMQGNNPFGPLQKSEVINKFGISSNIYKKIMDLFFRIIYNLKDNKDNGSSDNNKIHVDNDVIMNGTDENKIENENKKSLEQKIKDINALSEEMEKLFEDYKNQKNINNKDNKDNNKMEEEKKEKDNRKKTNLTPDEEKKLLDILAVYEKNVL